MNATLEDTFRVLFKSWFVNFDPVRAKAEGQSPFAIDAPTAALFPDGFGQSHLGEVPTGWEVGTLGAVAENPRRGVAPSDLSPDTAYIGLEHMPRRAIALGDWGTASDVSSGKTHFLAGEFLFGKLRPYFHKVGVAPVPGVCSTDILVVRQRAPAYRSFVLGHITSKEFVAFTDLGEGTKMPRTNWERMASWPVALPPSEVADAHARICDPMLARIRASAFQNRELAALRDYLLPKLLSGEVRVRDAEKLVEAVS